MVDKAGQHCRVSFKEPINHRRIVGSWSFLKRWSSILGVKGQHWSKRMGRLATNEGADVVISLSTSLFSVADANGPFTVERVPEGDYELHLWVEGQSQTTIDRWTKKCMFLRRTLRSAPSSLDKVFSNTTPNKSGQSYVAESNKPY